MPNSKFTLAVEGKLSAWMRADAIAMPKVHTMTVRAAGGRTRRGIVKQINASFTGKARRFAAAIKFRSYPPRGWATGPTCGSSAQPNSPNDIARRGRRL